MQSPFVDSAYLTYQYDTSVKLRIRAETHRLYTEGDEDFAAVELGHIDPHPGLLALDVGCGHGRLAAPLQARGMDYIGLDTSAGMLREARAVEPGRYVQGNALALPVADATCDRALALGMLYHVPGWQRALVELRRVVRPGGRVVLWTNGADAMRRIYDVHREAALELGYTPLPYTGSSFNLDHLPEVRAVFPTAVRHIRERALVFPEAEPALRFYATNRIDMIEGWERDTGHRARLLSLVREKIEAIIAREGSFRVPKTVGYFVADV